MNKHSLTKNILHLSLFALGVTLVLSLTPWLMKSPFLLETLANYGYFGVLVAGVVAGISVLVPIPAAALTPIFTEVGLKMPYIILALTIGTLIADFAGYSIGHLNRHRVRRLHPKLDAFFTTLQSKHHTLVLPVVFVYAAIAPVPNEAILIPLGLAGANFTPLIIPLFLGNLVHQTLLAYGFISIFGVMF